MLHKSKCEASYDTNASFFDKFNHDMLASDVTNPFMRKKCSKHVLQKLCILKSVLLRTGEAHVIFSSEL